MCSMNHIIFRIEYLVYNLVFNMEIRSYIKKFNAELCVLRKHGKLKYMTKIRLMMRVLTPWTCRQFHSSSHDENT